MQPIALKNLVRNLSALSCSAVCLQAISAKVSAADAPVPPSPVSEEKSWTRQFLEGDYMFGTWGGARTKLSERGVDFEFVYFGAVPSNVDGGIKEGTVYQGALLMTLDLNSQKLLGYEGGQFHLGSLWLHGEDHFSDNHIGDFNKVSLLDFPNDLRLWEVWYEQKFFENKVSLKVGQLAIDRDFIVPEFYNSIAGISLLNQTFFYPTLAFNVWDQPYFPIGDHALASTPYGAPGVRLRVDPCQHAYFQVGAYDGNPDREHGGLRVDLSESEGALLYFEAGLKFNQTKDAQGPPGNIKVGAYYHTDDFYDMYEGYFAAFDNFLGSLGVPGLGIYSTPRAHSGTYGLYFLADQTLWREVGKEDPAQQGLVGFFRVASAPKDENLTSFGIDGGLVYKGLIPGRDWDTIALAGSYLEMSEDIGRAQQDINSILVGAGAAPAFGKFADYEAVVELSYKAQLTAWWTVQPSVQRVIHPGGRVVADIPDSWAVIVQTTLRF